jgi:hypothetical protein
MQSDYLLSALCLPPAFTSGPNILPLLRASWAGHSMLSHTLTNSKHSPLLAVWCHYPLLERVTSCACSAGAVADVTLPDRIWMPPQVALSSQHLAYLPPGLAGEGKNHLEAGLFSFSLFAPKLLIKWSCYLSTQNQEKEYIQTPQFCMSYWIKISRLRNKLRNSYIHVIFENVSLILPILNIWL